MLLPALPAGLRPPVFVVLAPAARAAEPAGRTSSRRKCAVPVREAEDKEPVEAGTVYFAPPDYHLLVDDGPHAGACRPTSSCNYSRPSIDVLFESAADVYGDRLLGVLLTGANDDGAAGLAAVQRAGGCDGRPGPGDRAGPADGGGGAQARSGGFRPDARGRSRQLFGHSMPAHRRCIDRPMSVRDADTRVKCLLVDDLEENLAGARGAAAPRRRGGAAGALGRRGARAAAARTTSRWRSSTCRCRTWTASSSPS